MNSFYSNAQLKCPTHILHIDWGRFFLDGQYMDYDDPIHDDLTHLMEDELFNPSNPQIFYEFPTLNKCDCIHRIFTTCSNNIINADLEVYNSSYVYLYTVENIFASSYEPGEGCFDFPVDGVFYMKIIEEPGTLNEAAFGWYKITINTHSDIEDILDISVSNNDICRGQQVCVNISNIVFDYIYNIRWNNTLLTSGSIDPPPTTVNYCFTPQTFGTGVITVNSSDLCGDNAVFTQQINVKAFTDFVLPTPVCVGSAFNVGTITWCNGAVSGASYTWNWGDGTPNSITQSATHIYNSYGTYNVTLTVSGTSGTQSMTKQIQVNALPYNVTVSGARHTCAGISTYTITNPQLGTTYYWNIYPTNCGSLSSNSGTSVNVTWNSNNFPPEGYASIIVTSNNGCMNRDTIKVWKCCWREAPENVPLIKYDQIFSGPLYELDYFLNGVIEFQGTNTYNNINFHIGPETKIIINNNANTAFNNCQFSAECNYMWEGITVEQGSRLTVNGTAIGSSSISDAVNGIRSVNGARFTVYNTTFNRNLNGINVQTYPGSHTGTVSKCTFSSTLDAIPANLLPPYSNRRAETGMKITSVNSIQVGNTASTANQNIFKHLDYGVYIENSNVTFYNNAFGPMAPSSVNAIPINGYGIYADKSAFSGNILNIGSSINNPVYKNYFSSCAVGIRANSSYSANVNYNSYVGNRYSNFITEDYDQNITLKNNDFINDTVSIWINNFTNSNIDISNNVLNNIESGIVLSNVIPTPPSSVRIADNLIQYGFVSPVIKMMITGISLYNVQGSLLSRPYVYNNDIKFNNVSLNINTVRNGIAIQNSRMTLVELNRISYRNLPITTTQANRLNGVNMILSTNVILCSNELKYLGNGVRVEGFCDNSQFILNNFKRYNNLSGNQSYGFRFESATIGIQGTPTQTWDNTFDANFLSGTPNRGTGSIALQQQWNYKNNDNMYLYRLTYEQVPNTSHAGRNIFSTITCGQQGGFFMNGFSGNNEISLDSESEFLENDAENKYFKAYTLLNSESSFNESEAMLSSNISSSIDVENISKFSEVNRLVKDRLFDSADSLNQLIEPVNLIEKNMKTVNEIYLRTWAKGNYNLSLQDYTTLVDIAMQTPKTSGYGVIGAWVMVGRFDNTQETEKFSNNKINIISNNILMYPNPATSQLSFDGTESVAQIFIHDVMGRLVRVIDNQQLDNAISISISDLKKGIYIVTYTNELKEKVGFEKLTIN